MNKPEKMSVRFVIEINAISRGRFAEEFLEKVLTASIGAILRMHKTWQISIQKQIIK